MLGCLNVFPLIVYSYIWTDVRLHYLSKQKKILTLKKLVLNAGMHI